MSAQLTLLAHGHSILGSDGLFPSRNGHGKSMVNARGDHLCAHLSRALCVGSMTFLQTEFAPAIQTPVSPSSCLSQRWPQRPTPAEPIPCHSQDMVKPNLTFSRPQQQEYLPTPPATPSTAGPIPSMFTLPNETLDRVLSFLPTGTLPTLMRANKLCHVLAERQLYFKVQHIQLYESQENEQNKDWQCLRTLASRSSAATSVRHFAVRGLPWLHASEADLILRALGNMTKLCSLHLELGAPFERALVRDHLAMSTMTRSLCALNVTDAQTAIAFCGAALARRERDLARKVPLASFTPLSTLRIAPESTLDGAAVQQLLLALTRGRNGPQTGDLQVLQMAVECESEDELLKILVKLGKSLPLLETLGLQVRQAGHGHGGCGSDLEGSQDGMSDLSRRLGDVLAIFPSLRKFSLASASSGPVWTQEDAEAMVRGCQRLELLELQWSAWRAETTEGSQRWEFISPPLGHPFIRRNWVYEHASIS